MEKSELIWVDEKFAKQYNKLSSDEEKYKVFEEYLAKVTEESRNNFKANLGAIEEDVAIYSGLMLKVKQAFGKAKDEALTASYALWEEYDKERPQVEEKVKNLTDTLEPLVKQLDEINKKLACIDTYSADKLLTTIEKFSNLYGQSKEIFEFVVKNFKKEGE
jgi:uncharacterized coiled-coil DUF342 family protein